MDVCVSILTAKGSAAISVIALRGQKAAGIVAEVFTPADRIPLPGNFTVGSISAHQLIDQVVLGCVEKNSFEINCHGNPIIVEQIVELLCQKGAELVDADQLYDEIEISQANAVTVAGVRIIQNQIKAGLAEIVEKWQADDIETIKQDCAKILAAGQTARLIINGCKIVLAGEPNSGKSTLLNALAGREKAIVTDVAGTTRDCVSATCRTDDLLIEFFDTAGLDQRLLNMTDVDDQSQRRSLEIAKDADLILFVYDVNKSVDQEALQAIRNLGRKVQLVANKADLAKNEEADAVLISALKGDGIERLVSQITNTLGVADFDMTQPCWFTQSQKKILEEIQNTETIETITNEIQLLKKTLIQQ